MNDNLSASFILMAGAGLLAYWFYHLTGSQRSALLAKARAAGDPLAMDANGVPKVFSQSSPGGGLERVPAGTPVPYGPLPGGGTPPGVPS